MAACRPKKCVCLRFNFCVTDVLCSDFSKHLVDKLLFIGNDGVRGCGKIKTQTRGVFGGRRGWGRLVDAYNLPETPVIR